MQMNDTFGNQVKKNTSELGSQVEMSNRLPFTNANSSLRITPDLNNYPLHEQVQS